MCSVDLISVIHFNLCLFLLHKFFAHSSLSKNNTCQIKKRRKKVTVYLLPVCVHVWTLCALSEHPLCMCCSHIDHNSTTVMPRISTCDGSSFVGIQTFGNTASIQTIFDCCLRQAIFQDSNPLEKTT